MERLLFALHSESALEDWHAACLEQLEPFARLADPAESLDFVLLLGRRIPSSPPPRARLGVWYFAHEAVGDERPFFSEVENGEPVTHAALLRSDGDSTTVLEEGRFRTDRGSYTASRDRIQRALSSWPARACERLLAGLGIDRAPHTGLPEPRRQSGLRLRAAVTRRRLALAWERLLRHPQWNVGVLRSPIAELLATGTFSDAEVDWFPLDRHGFLADPFGVVREDGLDVLCERFDYRTGTGRIHALEYSDGGFAPGLGPAALPTGHVSYPFLLEDAGELYCAPETCDANEVALYRADEFPERWSKAAVLLEEFAGVDPTLFRHGGRWWLFCTRHGAYEDEELWAWYAAELAGPWTAHARNPIKTDVRASRPAGAPFVLDGSLYRPAQDCSRSYGGRITVQRVLELTPTEFEEQLVATIEPPTSGRFPLGIHTLTPLGDVVLLDGRRAIFSWPAFKAFVAIWMRDVGRKLGG